MFLNEQLRRMLSRYVRGQQPMTADENTWLTRILVDYYDRDLARDLLKEPPPGATEEEAKSYKTIYGTVESLDEVFRIMQSHQDAASQARLVNETTRKILEQFLTGGEDNTPDAVRSFLMSNPNFSNVTKPEFEALVKNISQQVEETYRNRARTIARTELAIAQSKTVAQELRAQGKTHVRIYDGLGCGWRHHDDGDYANGSLRLIEDYLNYPVAHPNCVRAGYPDFFGGDGSIHVGKKDLDLFEVELKYNPNHDRLGRFATSNGVANLLYEDQIKEALERDGFELDEEKLAEAKAAMENLNESYPKTAESVAFMFYGKEVVTESDVLGFYLRDGNDLSKMRPIVMLDQRLIATDVSIMKKQADIATASFNSYALKRAQTTGFHPNTKSPVSQIVNHEFAHHMEYVAYKEMQRRSRGKRGASPWSAMLSASSNGNPGAFAGYAKKNAGEAWAEGFSYVHEKGTYGFINDPFVKSISSALALFDKVIEKRK